MLISPKLLVLALLLNRDLFFRWNLVSILKWDLMKVERILKIFFHTWENGHRDTERMESCQGDWYLIVPHRGIFNLRACKINTFKPPTVWQFIMAATWIYVSCHPYLNCLVFYENFTDSVKALPRHILIVVIGAAAGLRPQHPNRLASSCPK